MLILSKTTDKLQAVLSGAVAANQLPCYCGWRDITTTAFLPERNLVMTNGTTDVDLAGFPSASSQRVIDAVSITNLDTAIATVTINVNDNGTKYAITTAKLAPGERLEYSEGSGWRTFTVNGSVKSAVVQDANAISNQMSVVVLSGDVTTAPAVANTITDITGLSFAVEAGGTYWFKFTIGFSSNSTNNGARFSINGPDASNVCVKGLWPSASTVYSHYFITAYDTPAASSAGAGLAGNVVILEGIITVTAAGTIQARFASEGATPNSITAKVGSMAIYQKVA